jgi:hypothetical protein
MGATQRKSYDCWLLALLLTAASGMCLATSIETHSVKGNPNCAFCFGAMLNMEDTVVRTVFSLVFLYLYTQRTHTLRQFESLGG